MAGAGRGPACRRAGDVRPDTATPGASNAALDAIALFGRATIDYERGAPEVAIDGYAATLIALSDGAAASGGLASLVAPVAAGRVLALFDEIGPASRRAIIERLAPLRLAHNPALPWLARVELLRLASHAAHEVGTRQSSTRIAGAGGCLNAVADHDHSDRSRAPTWTLRRPRTRRRAGAPSRRRAVVSSCRRPRTGGAGRALSAPRSFWMGPSKGPRAPRRLAQGDPALPLTRSAPRAPTTSLLDYAGEGRVSVTAAGAPGFGEPATAPRISATRVELGAGNGP